MTDALPGERLLLLEYDPFDVASRTPDTAPSSCTPTAASRSATRAASPASFGADCWPFAHMTETR